MGSKVWPIFVLLALAMVAECTKFHEVSWGLSHWGSNVVADSCVGGHCDIEGVTDILMMDSEMNVRQLAQGKRYIGYGALRANSVPCNCRGRSYYNCQTGGRANPYSRGCSAITRCRRSTG